MVKTFILNLDWLVREGMKHLEDSIHYKGFSLIERSRTKDSRTYKVGSWIQDSTRRKYNPRASAENFVSLVDDSMDKAILYNRSLGNFDPDNPQKHSPSFYYTNRLGQELNASLREARITPIFGVYIVELVRVRYGSVLTEGEEVLPEYPHLMMDPKEVAGINLNNEEYGIFDKQKAQGVEKHLLERNRGKDIGESDFRGFFLGYKSHAMATIFYSLL